MAKAGATRFIFMWEAMDGDDDQSRLKSATEFAKAVVNAGLRCGVSISPDTAIESLWPLLLSGLVDLVDILAVEPGFGGQNF
jgi:pentose-5-phosphate-3-epimerase